MCSYEYHSLQMDEISIIFTCICFLLGLATIWMLREYCIKSDHNNSCCDVTNSWFAWRRIKGEYDVSGEIVEAERTTAAKLLNIKVGFTISPKKLFNIKLPGWRKSRKEGQTSQEQQYNEPPIVCQESQSKSESEREYSYSAANDQPECHVEVESTVNEVVAVIESRAQLRRNSLEDEKVGPKRAPVNRTMLRYSRYAGDLHVFRGDNFSDDVLTSKISNDESLRLNKSNNFLTKFIKNRPPVKSPPVATILPPNLPVRPNAASTLGNGPRKPVECPYTIMSSGIEKRGSLGAKNNVNVRFSRYAGDLHVPEYFQLSGTAENKKTATRFKLKKLNLNKKAKLGALPNGTQKTDTALQLDIVESTYLTMFPHKNTDDSTVEIQQESEYAFIQSHKN